MVDILSKLVTGDQLVGWLVIGFLVIYFIYKEWPEFKKRISKSEVKEHKDNEAERSLDTRLATIEKDVKEIKEKLGRDYDRINEVEQKQKRYQAMIKNEAEELELIMEALLGALGGIQELGANGPTREAKDKLQNYLNKQAHRSEEE